MSTQLPVPAQRAMRKLGQDIKEARLRRRIPASLLAERANISPKTLIKIEKGDPSVSISSYVAVIFSLGMISRVEELMDVRFDNTGLILESERLPKRIRLPRKTEVGSYE